MLAGFTAAIDQRLAGLIRGRARRKSVALPQPLVTPTRACAHYGSSLRAMTERRLEVVRLASAPDGE